MTNPVTHLIWGYLLGRAFSPAPRYIFLGMMMGVVMDVDQFLPGVAHHGWVHTPVFVLCLAGAMLLATRERMVLWMSLAVLLSHLVLDTVATQDPVMWLWPVSTEGFALWTVDELAALAVVKVYAFLVPAYYVWHRWRVEGESPLAVLEWIDDHIPRPVTYGGLASFGVAMVAVWWAFYARILLG